MSDETPEKVVAPTRDEALEYKEQLGVVRTREEAEEIAAEESNS